MRKNFLWVLFLLLCVGQLYPVTQINPQPGSSLWSIIQGWGQVVDETWPGEPTVISTADLVGGVITISASGIYILSENIPNGRFNITADQVHLDLNGRRVECDTASQDVVTIGTGRERVTICNGFVRHSHATPGHGIIIGAGSSSVRICDVNVEGCTHGIMLDGQEGSEVVDCEIVACDLVSNTTGVVLHNADENVISHCQASLSAECGFELRYSEYNGVVGCRAIETTSSGATKSAQGFVTNGGQGNLFEDCIAKKSENDGGVGTVATGFTLTGTEIDTKIIECLVNTTTAMGDGEGYGMLLTWTTTDLAPGPPSDCILQKNIIAGCGTGVIGQGDAFTTLGNLAIENIAFNNNVHYMNVLNVFNYSAAGSDTTDAIENAGVSP